MKRVVWILAVLSLVGEAVSFAQQTEAVGQPSEAKPQTKLEAFLSSKGTLVVKEFYELGKVGGLGSGLSIDAVVVTQPGQDDQRIRGLRIEVSEAGRLERSNTSFLDMEEIDSLSKALAYMADLAAKWKPVEKQEYTEVQFATKGEFRIGFYQRKKNQGGFVSSGAVGPVRASIDVQDLGKVKALVDQGLSVLQSK